MVQRMLTPYRVNTCTKCVHNFRLVDIIKNISDILSLQIKAQSSRQPEQKRKASLVQYRRIGILNYLPKMKKPGRFWPAITERYT